jgi:hypothetical protein
MNRFKKMKGLAFLCTVLLVGGFAIGYLSGLEPKPDRLHRVDISGLGNGEAAEDDGADEAIENTTVDQIDGRHITRDTRLILKTKYLDCGHIVVDRTDIPDDILGFDEEQLQDYYEEWEIEEFNSEQIVLVQSIPGICTEHYLLGVQGDYLAVYGFGRDGEPVLNEVTDIPISILRLNDQQRLRKGILLNSMEEVNRFIEEYGS